MAAFALDIRSASGTSRMALAGQSLVMGRSKEAQIFLDSRTISRRHAELYCDPFGRWWVRDLGSHNGTLVNGARVAEQVLKPGDLVQVGEFSLTLSQEESGSRASTGGSHAETSGVQGIKIPVVDADGGRLASLRDFESPRLGAQHLSILSEFGAQLATIESATERLKALCALMVRREFHGRSAIALRVSKEAFTEAPKPLCAPQTAPGDETLSPYISKTLLRMLLARNEPVLASNSGATGGGGGEQNMAELSLAADVMTVSAVACPVKSERRYTDLLYVLLPPAYGNSEWLALTSLAVKQFQQAEANWASRRLSEEHSSIERELERARAIQTRLVPKADVIIPSLDFAIGFVPCRWVGGDYVDIVKGKDGRVLLTIADVCGKGLPAAMVASRLHMSMHMGMRAGAPLADIINELNVYLAETLTEGTFVTAIAVMLDSVTGTYEAINAGHPAGLMITPAGEISLTQEGANLPLGLDRDALLTGETGTLPRNSYLVLFTDGLSELPIANGDLLGETALGEHMARLVTTQTPAPTSAELSQQLTQLLDSIQEGMSRDDRTFLIARRV